MNAKKILAFILAIAMMFGMMNMSVFAELQDDTYPTTGGTVTVTGDTTTYDSLTDAAASTSVDEDGVKEYTITGAVEYVTGTDLAGGATKVIIKDGGNGELTLTTNYHLGITAKDAALEINGIKMNDRSDLSNAESALTAWEWAYITFDVGGLIELTNVTFTEGVQLWDDEAASINGCTFDVDVPQIYSLWVATSEKVVVDNCSFIGTRGIKTHGAYATADVVVDIEVTDCTFDGLTEKPALVHSNKNGGTIALEDNTYTDMKKGVYASEAPGTISGTDTSLVKAAVTEDGETTYFLTKEDAEAEADGKPVLPVVAEIEGVGVFTSMADAVAAATANDTIVLLDDVTVAEDTRWKKAVNIDLNDKTMYLTTSLTFNADATVTNGTINADNVTVPDGIIRADYHHGSAVTLTFKDVTVSAENSKYSTGVFYLHSDDDKLILDNTDVVVSGANDDPGSGVFYSPSSFKRGDVVLTNGTTITAESVTAIFFASDAKIEDAVITGKGVYRPVFRQADGVVVNSEITIETMRDGDAVVEDVAGQNSGVVTFINSTVDAPEGTAFAKSNNEGSTVYADDDCVLSDETGVTAVKTVATASELVDAINNAKTGEFIFLSADIESDDQIVIPEEKKLTINLAGYDIVVAFAGAGVVNNGELTVMDTTDEGCIYTTNTEAQSRHAIINNGILTIESGNFGSSASRGAALQNNGTATINGGSFTALDNYSIDNGYAYAIINRESNAVLTINDATVSGNMNGCIAADDGKVIINGGSYTLGDGSYGATLWNVLYSWKGEIIVNDGTFTKQDISGASWVEQMVVAGEKGIVVNGGTFADTTHDVPAFQGQVDITGPITVIGANDNVIVDNAAPVAMLFTDPDKNGSFDGKFYADVDDALAAAVSGDTLKLGAGTFGAINLPQGVSIEGTVGANGELLSVIDGRGNTALQLGDAKAGAVRTIKNLKIKSTWKGIYGYYADEITIDNVDISMPVYGIHFQEPTGKGIIIITNSVIDCTWANSIGAMNELIVSGNTFKATETYYEGVPSAGINSFAKTSSVKENVFDANSGMLIRENAVAGADVTENYFEDLSSAIHPNATKTVELFPVYADEEMTTLSTVDIVTSKQVANVSVELPFLAKEVDNATLTENAKYEVSITPATAGNGFTAYAEAGKKVVYFDISVLKNGAEVALKTEQTVKVTLNTPIEGDITVKHWNGTAWEDVSATTAGNTVTFDADSLSPFAFAYGVATLATDDIATNITASLEKVSDNEYNIILTGDDDKTINRFASAELDIQLVNDDAKGKVAMTVEGAGFVSVIDPAFNDSNLYEFNLDGVNAPDLTGNKLHIGTVKLAGYGEAELFLGNKTGVMVNTVKVNTNIVNTFVPSATATEGVLTVDDTAAEVVLVRPTQALTVNITFPNNVEDNDADYQKMTVVVSGSDLTAPITRELGGNAKADGSYSVLFADLTRGNPYTVTVSGDGYRTARYTVTMSENKTLNFWNDLKVVAEEVEVGNNNYTTTTTFLAGDIVADNDINVYDLSAVVSYFGEVGLKNLTPAEYAKYIKYDLNRDGKIDSKDVAYVLASWEA